MTGKMTRFTSRGSHMPWGSRAPPILHGHGGTPRERHEREFMARILPQATISTVRGNYQASRPPSKGNALPAAAPLPACADARACFLPFPPGSQIRRGGRRCPADAGQMRGPFHSEGCSRGSRPCCVELRPPLSRYAPLRLSLDIRLICLAGTPRAQDGGTLRAGLTIDGCRGSHGTFRRSGVKILSCRIGRNALA
jgi:hypothetical protein